jgi:hypothetical protein
MRSINKFILFITILALGASCIKEVDVNKGITNNERTIIKLPQASEELFTFALDARDRIDTLKVLEVRRDAVTSAGLQEALTVKIAPNNGAITAYNTDNGTNLVPFTDYTLISDNGVKMEGANYVVPFAAGEFVKFIRISFNTSKLDLSKRNAMAFKVIDGGGATISVSQEALIEIAIKNKYDGVYKLTVRSDGWAAYGIADGVSAVYPEDYDLITAGVSSVTGFSTYRGDNLLPAFTSAMAPTGFGATSPIFVFDPANNKLVEVRNTIPDDGRGRKLKLNPAVTTSRFDADTKTVYAAFIMSQNGRPDQLFYDTLKYVGPR